MKPPDRLFEDLGVFGLLVKFWLALPLVFFAVVGTYSLVATEGFEVRNVLAGAVMGGVQVVAAVFVIVVGGKLLITLFQMTRANQGR